MAISLTADNVAFAPGHSPEDLRNLQSFRDNPNNTYYQNRYNEIMLKRNPNFFAPKPAAQQSPMNFYGNALAQRNAAAQLKAAMQQKMLGSGGAGSSPIAFRAPKAPVNIPSPSSLKKDSRYTGRHQGAMDFDRLYSALTIDGSYDQSDVDTMSRYLQEAILGGNISGSFGKTLFSRYNKPSAMQLILGNERTKKRKKASDKNIGIVKNLTKEEAEEFDINRRREAINKQFPGTFNI